jgi:hypothetical protein
LRLRAQDRVRHGVRESRDALLGAREAKERRAKEQEAREREAREREMERDVVPWLRALGCRAADARRAAEYCQDIPDASLGERLRIALRYLAPPHRTVPSPAGASHNGNGA